MKPLYKYIIGVAVVLLLVGVFLFWQSWSSPTPAPQDQQTGTVSSSLLVDNGNNNTTNTDQTTPLALGSPSSTSASNLTKLSDFPAFDYWVLHDTKEVYYITKEGRVYAAKDGNDVEISDQTISAINSTTPSDDGKKLLVSFGDPNNPQWGIFDVVDKMWRPLPAGILQATWGGSADRLVVVSGNATTKELLFMDLTKTPPAENIITRGFSLLDVGLRFESPDTLFITERPTYSYSGRIWKLNTKTLSFDLISSPQRGLWVGWNRENTALFKLLPETNTSLFSDQNGNNEQTLPFLAFPTKCTVRAQELVLCFVPQNISQDSSLSSLTLPDDYLQRAVYTKDDIQSFNIKTKEIGLPFDTALSDLVVADASMPQIEGNALYFLNRLNGTIYSLKLSPLPQNETATSTPPSN